MPSLSVAYAINLQPLDDKILVAGSTFNTLTLNRDFVILRYLPDGDLDTSFGPNGDGIVMTDFAGRDDYARALAIDSAGRIVVAGDSREATTQLSDIALARYDAAGILDPGFSGDGKIRTNLVRVTGSDDNDIARALVIAPGDQPVVAGESGYFDPATPIDYPYDFVLIRYDANGQRDPGFGSSGNGVVFTDFNGGSDAAYALARYDAQGILDTTFDNDGRIVADFFFDDDYAYALAIQADSKIVVAGTTTTIFNTDIALARFDEAGVIDQSFVGGLWAADFGNNEECRALVIQADGKFLAAGFVYNGGQYDFAALRINP